jgi:two-component system sensor histidine kinase DevS
VLRSPRVVLEVRRDGLAESFVVEPAPRRPLSDLPGVFWFQVCAGVIGFLVSLWVFVLRPGVVGVRMFALAGMMILGFTAPAAVYSTRELAIDGGLFRALSTLNHLGAISFGVGLVGIFVMFPTPLVRPRVLWVLPAVFIPWFVLDATRIAPDQSWGSRVPIMLETLLAIAFAIVQWRRAKGDARARASLRWFGVCVLTGASCFVFSVVGTTILGMLPPIPQGYSFGFFLLMHVGLALGLRQTRLFELNELSYLVLFWVVGALALVALDAAVLLLVDTRERAR